MSAFKKPLSPDGGVLEGARKRTIGTTERTEASTTSRQPIHGGGNDAVSAPSSTSVITAVLPGATQLHVPRAHDLGFLLPGAFASTSSAALPMDSEGLGRRPTTHAQGFRVPTDGASDESVWQREAIERAPPPGLNLSARQHVYGFLPVRQGFDPTQPRPRSNPEHNPFDMASGDLNAFGLQPLAYGESTSFLPSTSASASASASQVDSGITHYAQTHHGPTDAAPATIELGHHADTGMPDLSLGMDDDPLTQAWSNLPPAIMGPG